MTPVLFKFIIYPSCERALNSEGLKSQMFRKRSLNLTFGQGSCLTLDFVSQIQTKTSLITILDFV